MQEIAELEGVAISTVSRTIKRGMKNLEKSLDMSVIYRMEVD